MEIASLAIALASLFVAGVALFLAWQQVVVGRRPFGRTIEMKIGNAGHVKVFGRDHYNTVTLSVRVVGPGALYEMSPLVWGARAFVDLGDRPGESLCQTTPVPVVSSEHGWIETVILIPSDELTAAKVGIHWVEPTTQFTVQSHAARRPLRGDDTLERWRPEATILGITRRGRWKAERSGRSSCDPLAGACTTTTP